MRTAPARPPPSTATVVRRMGGMGTGGLSTRCLNLLGLLVGGGWRRALSGHPPERRGPACLPHRINEVVAIGAVRSATLRARHADVRAGRMSEARPRSAAEDQPSLDRRTPQILIWGMGGAAAILPVATAARGARTGADHDP